MACVRLQRKRPAKNSYIRQIFVGQVDSAAAVGSHQSRRVAQRFGRSAQEFGIYLVIGWIKYGSGGGKALNLLFIHNWN